MDMRRVNFANLLAEESHDYDYERLAFRMRCLLKNITFTGRRVLEIGCGTGSMSLYMALHGAAFVVGLDPEAQGAAYGSTTRFRQRIRRLRWDNVAFVPTRIENSPFCDGAFDIILCYDVINHIYETEHDLNKHPADRQRYVEILRELHRVLAPGGVAIVADCSRRNFFADLHLPHPMPGVRLVEWAIHQTPQTWIDVMREAGFSRFRRGWHVFYPLRHVPWLTDNQLFAYFTTSHFTIWAFRD